MQRAGDLAVELARKLARETAGVDVQQALFERALAALPESMLALAETKEIEIVSAESLSSDQVARLKAQLSGLGYHGAACFRVDPMLLAGLQIRVSDAILHFDWEDALTRARDALRIRVEPRDALEDWFAEAERRVQALELSPRWERLGRVEEIGDGVATVSGLADLRMDEAGALRERNDGPDHRARARPHRVSAAGDAMGIRAGGRVHATGAVVRVPVGSGVPRSHRGSPGADVGRWRQSGSGAGGPRRSRCAGDRRP